MSEEQPRRTIGSPIRRCLPGSVAASVSEPEVSARTEFIALLETLGPTESEADAIEHDVRSAIHDLWRGDPDELTEWAPRIRQAAARAKDTHVLMNNCYAN